MTEATRKIRIVHCIGTLRRGGSEHQLVQLIERLPKDRFEQSVVVIFEEGPLAERVRAAGVPILNLGYAPEHSKADPRFWLRLKSVIAKYTEYLRGEHPDIVYAKLFWANVLSVAAGRRAGIDSIITSRVQLSDYKQGKAWMQWVENHANKRTSVVVSNSDAVRQDTLKHEKIDSEKIRLIYNGIDLSKFDTARGKRDPLRAELGIPDRAVLLIVVANLHPYKGHVDLIRAMAAMPEDANVHAIFPGRDMGERKTLERQIEELGLASRVHLLGERNDVPELLQASDIAIHPSHQEGFSNAILEAMTARLPVIATAVGGNVEQVESGATGYLIQPADSSIMAKRISELVSDEPLRKQMAEAGRARVEKLFSTEAMVQNFVHLFEELADKR